MPRGIRQFLRHQEMPPWLGWRAGHRQQLPLDPPKPRLHIPGAGGEKGVGRWVMAPAAAPAPGSARSSAAGRSATTTTTANPGAVSRLFLPRPRSTAAQCERHCHSPRTRATTFSSHGPVPPRGWDRHQNWCLTAEPKGGHRFCGSLQEGGRHRGTVTARGKPPREEGRGGPASPRALRSRGGGREAEPPGKAPVAAWQSGRRGRAGGVAGG